jgi:hypothetical protein
MCFAAVLGTAENDRWLRLSPQAGVIALALSSSKLNPGYFPNYAFDPNILSENPPADIELAKIGDLLNYDLAAFLKKQ